MLVERILSSRIFYIKCIIVYFIKTKSHLQCLPLLEYVVFAFSKGIHLKSSWNSVKTETKPVLFDLFSTIRAVISDIDAFFNVSVIHILGSLAVLIKQNSSVFFDDFLVCEVSKR